MIREGFQRNWWGKKVGRRCHTAPLKTERSTLPSGKMRSLTAALGVVYTGGLPLDVLVRTSSSRSRPCNFFLKSTGTDWSEPRSKWSAALSRKTDSYLCTVCIAIIHVKKLPPKKASNNINTFSMQFAIVKLCCLFQRYRWLVIMARCCISERLLIQWAYHLLIYYVELLVFPKSGEAA